MENSVKISPSISGAASAVLGMGAGYALAPRKYSLERLLMQNNDSFEKTFSSDTMQGASHSELASLDNIKSASKTYFSSGDKILKEQIAPNAKKWNSLISKVEVSDFILKDVERQKNAYKKAIKDSNYYELKKALDAAKKKAEALPKDVNLNLEMKDAARKFAEAQIAIEAPAAKYKQARNSFRAARSEAILKLPDKGRAISAQWDKVRRAMTDRANLMYEKLATLSKSEGLKNDYSLIKKYIPKARTASALTGGILAGLAGVVLGVYSVHKFNNNA